MLVSVESVGHCLSPGNSCPGRDLPLRDNCQPRGMFNPILYTETYDAYIIDVVYDGLIEH